MRSALLMTHMVGGCIYVYSVYILSIVLRPNKAWGSQFKFFNMAKPLKTHRTGWHMDLSFCWVQVLYNTGCIYRIIMLYICMPPRVITTTHSNIPRKKPLEVGHKLWIFLDPFLDLSQVQGLIVQINGLHHQIPSFHHQNPSAPDGKLRRFKSSPPKTLGPSHVNGPLARRPWHIGIHGAGLRCCEAQGQGHGLLADQALAVPGQSPLEAKWSSRSGVFLLLFSGMETPGYAVVYN